MTGHLPEHDPWADPAGGWGPPGTADAAPPVDDAAPDSSGPEPQPVGEVVADVVAGLYAAGELNDFIGRVANATEHPVGAALLPSRSRASTASPNATMRSRRCVTGVPASASPPMSPRAASTCRRSRSSSMSS